MLEDVLVLIKDVVHNLICFVGYPTGRPSVTTAGVAEEAATALGITSDRLKLMGLVTT